MSTKTRVRLPSISFRERNPVTLGMAGVLVVGVLLVVAFNAHAVVQRVTTYGLEAVFAEAGGLKAGDDVRVAGQPVGKVTSVELDHKAVLVGFRVHRGLALRGQTGAQIKTATALGRKYLAVQPAGSGVLRAGDRIPLSRTQSAYDVTQALAQLATTADALDSRQIAGALDQVSKTFDDTPKQFARALSGIQGLSDTVARRDDQLQQVFHRAATVSGVLRQKQDQVQQLVVDGDALAKQLVQQRISINQLVVEVNTLATQLQGLVDDGRAALRPALLELRKALKLVVANRDNLDQVLRGLGPFARALGESVGSGPFFESYLGNFTPDGFPVFKDGQ